MMNKIKQIYNTIQVFLSKSKLRWWAVAAMALFFIFKGLIMKQWGFFGTELGLMMIGAFIGYNAEILWKDYIVVIWEKAKNELEDLFD